MESLLAGKRFYCREWAFGKLADILDKKGVSDKAGVLIVGSPGCGKTAFLSELCFPEIGSKLENTIFWRETLTHNNIPRDL